MNTKEKSSISTSGSQQRRVYETPALTRLPLQATLGGSVATCDAACQTADNTFPESAGDS